MESSKTSCISAHFSINTFIMLRCEQFNLGYVQPVSGRKISCYITGKSPISAPLQQSFLCKHALNVTLSNPTTGNCDVILQYKAKLHFMWTVYIDIEAYLCDRSKEIGLLASLKSASTISCGFILAVCAVCTIVIHSAKRTWFTARQPYMTLN
ncbi:Protein CBG08672 [Trichuris trichiura]|uniref:Protein CBG08672 n=1 Tax=Trichuris trichiura TaxID=36087 RepID=A0A077Z3K1_TRITR|nr:Protein CBG08672 [Trichuris trichiura]